MEEKRPHITICVCTFRRPKLLAGLLQSFARQKTQGLFSYSTVIVDNDSAESSRAVAEQAQSRLSSELLYCVEPRQNIALARNKALANAHGEFIAFIDDDELPGEEWLLKLFQTCESYQADGVLGPVLPRFEQEPPAWVTKGGFCDRPLHETGFIIDPNEGRTGNLLLRKSILAGVDPVFLPEFGGGGEDRNFFKRMIEKGHRFVWCNEAAVDEVVPPLRCKRSFMLRRALLRGKMSSSQHGGIQDLIKSIIAITGYTVALPVLFLMGQHFFMKYLIKICDHAGKLLAVAGLNPIRESYILE